MKIKAGSKRNEIVGVVDINPYQGFGAALLIKVKPPPEKGKANEKVLDLLAAYLKYPSSKLRIESGMTHSLKIIWVPSLYPQQS